MAVDRAAFRAVTPRLPGGSSFSFALLNLMGLAIYLHPFVAANTDRGGEAFTRATDGPVVMAGVAALCLVMVISELTEGAMNSKTLAILGVLAALAAVLRTVTLPAGANLYFFLVILGGYAFGARTGFLLGALSFALSAIVTGGVGPWLPFQVFASAWMGLTAGLLRPVVRSAGLGGKPEVAAIAVFGAAWGYLYGAITNLWFWPFWVGGPDVTYEPGLGFIETARRYWNYYLLTSLGWDTLRATANVFALAAVGLPMIRALDRFRERFNWTFERES